MFDAIADDTRLLFIANPNNPTGTVVPGDKVASFLERVQAAHGDRVTVVLDEAYQPFAERSWMPQVLDAPNVVVMRTVSKIGLAGLRAPALQP
ncbi:hypothetical protein G6F57_022793 [Rhizopus arrhizus]|nr:hypothetical protein G6F57_022793 [Rhizopus arrhizus]